MQPIRHEPEYLKGFEILTFDLVELEKIRGDGAHTFATLGNLSVFYFDYFERFILLLNNWKYCLLPRIPTTAVTNVGEIDSRNFVMPAYDGIYTLKLGQNFNPAALHNFVTILSNSTKFSREEGPINEIGLNPGLVRSQLITQPLNQPVSTYERPAELGLSSNYENIMQPTVNSGLDKSKKKGRFSKIKEKLRRKPKSNKKKEVNLNMTQARDFASIKATPESMVNTVEFKRTEIEEIIVSTKDILHRMESASLPKSEEIKEKVIGIVDAIKEGVHDIRERIAERNEYEAQTGQHIGILQIVKEGVMEIRDRITHRGHLEEGELEPPEIEGERATATTKPGIVDTVKNSVHELKQRASVRHELAGAPGEVGIMDIVKEGYLEIKEKIANMRHEEPTTIVTEKIETTTYSGTPLKETRLGQITIHEPPAFYHSPRERLKIFDDKYLDQPLRAEPFPISGEAGKDMVLHYEEILRQTHNPESGVKYEEDKPGLFERIKASLSSGKKTGPGVYEPKETQWPEGHAPGNISSKIKDIIPSKSHVPAELSFMDKVKKVMKGSPDHRHSPVSKREYIKAAIPVLFKGAGHEEEEEGGQFGGLVRAGGMVGIMHNEGLSGITNTIIPAMKKKDQEFRVYTPETAIQSVSIPEMRNVHPTPAPLYEQRNLEKNFVPNHLQPVTNVVQVSQVHPENVPSAYTAQSRIVEQRVVDSRVVNAQSQYSSVVTDRVYEVDLA